jgi:GNAT superfamily N-acetyltransferase
MPVRPITIAESFDAALPLMQANWHESGDDFAFEPSREFYLQAEAMGLLFAVGAFMDEKLVGYAVVTVAPHPFNPAFVVANGNPLYVSPEYRCGLLTGKLMLVAEEQARLRGARKFHWVMRAGSRAADTLCDHGYRCIDMVVEKELTAWA